MNLYCIIPMYQESHPWSSIGLGSQTMQPQESLIVHDGCNCSISRLEFNANVVQWFRKERHYTAKNIWDAIINLRERHRLQSSDIICLIDGDDKLFDNTVLQTVYQAYKQYDCWLTYGSHVWLSHLLGNKPEALYRGRYRTGDIFRKTQWRASHLKTFRYGLWQHLPESALKDESGEWLKTCSDLAIMFPLLEMAGHSRIRHINRPLYIYNDLNPLNDHKIASKEQKEMEYWLRDKKPFEELRSL